MLLSFWALMLGGGSGAFPAREEGHLWGYWPEVGKGPSATYALLDNEESFPFPQGAVVVPFDLKDKELITKG
uniref:Uncharacterized protein n=1 Tax=Triticum urartu TaxID=4572 RepID=A0A8R7UV88_TRIUA